MTWKNDETRRKHHREYWRRKGRQIRMALTARRKNIVLFCHEYAQANGYAAGANDIMTAVGLKRYNAYYENMRVLRDMGYLTFEGDRQIKVLMLP